MKTEGNPVDSVIQYQLHRKSEGGGGGSFESAYANERPLIMEYTDTQTKTLTQEDIDNDPILQFIEASVGNTADIGTLNITYNQFLYDNHIFFYSRLFDEHATIMFLKKDGNDFGFEDFLNDNGVLRVFIGESYLYSTGYDSQLKMYQISGGGGGQS